MRISLDSARFNHHESELLNYDRIQANPDVRAPPRRSIRYNGKELCPIVRMTFCLSKGAR
ncbi:hypothetical protein THF1C08_90162 [Vibrio jasicida]|uniref:Uncharacterized protein n=1 Tax=Vibrio jasicida TaxID=766224 RepID=A0AAU9QZX4_9VIBR|nr:hypothetical protein THF1C08_90162 [Vibrio jasicida]CAH1603778.1 hypothetical protein THF1A12_80156 [Vibrio jasicida]